MIFADKRLLWLDDFQRFREVRRHWIEDVIDRVKIGKGMIGLYRVSLAPKERWNPLETMVLYVAYNELYIGDTVVGNTYDIYVDRFACHFREYSRAVVPLITLYYTMWVASPWGCSVITIQPARHECHACCQLQAEKPGIQPVVGNTHDTHVKQVVSSFQKILRVLTTHIRGYKT